MINSIRNPFGTVLRAKPFGGAGKSRVEFGRACAQAAVAVHTLLRKTMRFGGLDLVLKTMLLVTFMELF